MATTQCKTRPLKFQDLGRRKVIGDFSGGHVSSDAGAILLREIDKASCILKKFSECFVDYRNGDLIEHTVEELIAQRVYGIALGYEDLEDHDRLRTDPLIATLVGKMNPTGTDRKQKRDYGKACAGKSTLNRLELTREDASESNRYKKIVYDKTKIQETFINLFIEEKKETPKEIIFDLDATDDPLYGKQEGRFYHGYYGEYCYLPLYIFSGEDLLWSELRPSNIDAQEGSKEALDLIVKKLREKWSDVRIIIRGDSGFCREELMEFCEENDIEYILGIAQNARLLKKITKALHRAKRRYFTRGEATRRYVDFKYQTLKSWSRSRRVIGTAEYLEKGSNPRFIVTSLSKKEIKARELYEKVYCARGNMENRIKEQQLGLFADRTSTHTLRANQLRLWFSSMAYVLLMKLRQSALKNTQLKKAQVWTIREKLLKIGAIVSVSIRRVYLQLSSHHPSFSLFETALSNIRCAYPLRI